MQMIFIRRGEEERGESRERRKSWIVRRKGSFSQKEAVSS
jgi:hypothetical protein